VTPGLGTVEERERGVRCDVGYFVYRHQLTVIYAPSQGTLKARYFKGMIKAAEHASAISRLQEVVRVLYSNRFRQSWITPLL
jgi:hypothetical protein